MIIGINLLLIKKVFRFVQIDSVKIVKIFAYKFFKRPINNVFIDYKAKRYSNHYLDKQR
jgi:hypothetical protein